jgi:hypothetical protein
MIKITSSMTIVLAACFFLGIKAQGQEAPKKQVTKSNQISKSKWVTKTKTDKMTSKTWVTSTVDSSNSLSLDFPYQGRNRGQLIIRKDVEGLDAVIVAVDKGQIQCNSWESCVISVRFDDADPIRVNAIGPADNDTTVVFINEEKTFIENATKATRILISLPFFRNGQQILEFNTGMPLVWTVTP